MPDSTEETSVERCSFCGKDRSEAVRLIWGGPGKPAICDLCVVLCQEIIEEQSSASEPSQPPDRSELTPKIIYEKLCEYVIGQDRAKKALSVAVYNHYKRIWAGYSKDEDTVELQKTNILLSGPTGSGKTLLAQTLAKILDVPFSIADATSLTEAGYVGDDVENILLRLIQAADYDINKAEHGIIYIDEIDKIGRKSANPSITRDVSGEGVQQALLKIIEGCVASVPPQGGRKHPHQELIQIKTDNILFICGGAFEGLEDIITSRVAREYHSLGFKSKFALSTGDKEQNVLLQLIPEDLLAFGFIPELVGRLPLVVSLEALDKESLIRVLIEPKNAIIKQYQKLLSLDGVDLIFTDDALEAAADETISRKSGARGLRGIIEKTLLDVMYELPSVSDVIRCTVTGDAVMGLAVPILLESSGSTMGLGLSEEKTA